MATLKGIATKLQGSAGDMTFRRRSGTTVVSEKVTSVTNTRTSAQQKHRMKWGNVVQMYKGITPLLKNGFENKAQGVTDYNMFVKLNMKLTPVYLTKSEVEGGACVVAPYQLSQGSIPAIVVTGEGSDRVTDIALGSLIISESTTVAQFSNAVVENNSDYNYGDQISFFDIRQRVNAATNIPYGYFSASYVVLDKDNTATLWSVVSQLGFQSKSGFLGCGTISEDGAFCWIHSRSKNGSTLVSSQILQDNNSLLESYTSQDAYDAAVATYGGESEVFLSPTGGGSSSSSSANSSSSSNTGSTTTKYTLSLSASPSNGGTVTGAGSYDAGTSVTVKATANSGYTFSKWQEDGNTNASRTVTVNSNQTLTAVFTASSTPSEDGGDDEGGEENTNGTI